MLSCTLYLLTDAVMNATGTLLCTVIQLVLSSPRPSQAHTYSGEEAQCCSSTVRDV